MIAQITRKTSHQQRINGPRNLRNTERFKRMNITDIQIKNFLTAQQGDFLAAVETKDITGFSDDEEGNSLEKLTKISKY
jgi:hypothetical protein